MKNLQLVCLFVALTACLVRCDDFGGVSYILTPSNSDNNSCLLNISVITEANEFFFNITSYVPDPANPDCTDPFITTAPQFYNTPFTRVSVNITRAADHSLNWSGQFTFADFQAALGSACQFGGTFSGQGVGICRFHLDPYIYFYVGFTLTNGGSSFDTTNYNVISPEYGTVVSSTRFGFPIWIQNPDPNYPHIIGRTENGCNTWNNQVTLSTEVLVLGTNYLGDEVNLQTYFSGAVMLNVIVLKNGDNAKNYISKSFYGTPFNNKPNAQGCTDLGIKYGDFLPNASYCSNGCAFSISIIKNTQVFSLPTNGFRTVSSLRV